MVCFATPGSGLRLRCAKRVAMCSSAGGGQRFDLVTLGNVVVDVLVPMAGFPVVAGGHQDLRGGGVALSPGGASNALIVGSRLGMHTSAVDWLREDAFGDFLLSKLSSLGVGTDGIERRPGQSLACVILVSESGDHTFIASNEKPTAQFDPHISSDSALKSLPSSFTSTISNANALLVDGYALDDLPFITLLGAIQLSQKHGCEFWFDPQAAAGTLRKTNKDLTEFLLSSSTGLVVTEDELEAFTSQSSASQVLGSYPNLKYCIVKQGSSGCQVAHRNEKDSALEQHSIQAFDIGDTYADSAGAGDSFIAGFITGLG
uniref:Carbohydrate kinase PfkB domain-containing protein n=1 Tax=Rhodosorus marinus TaxID=101924 RepID=A0A7S3EP72_9RHOD|mmetsp:Transcript_6239/g.26389  ORF Transcript_6239/g.26389 Transcript_6239/m.26389 type:complete len:317 (+) Transcript_6239:330-1280(+)